MVNGYVLLNPFQCDHASWWLHAGVVPSHGVAMDTSLFGLNLPRLPFNLSQATFSQEAPKLI